MQTPRVQSQPLPAQQVNVTPTQTSPPTKSTPTKSALKALPTVRDHTTDQLGPEGDEYIPREYDDAGEKKVNTLGYPQEGRDFRCRTFRVPNRGDKLFMLATECARVLGYRDSYLLFNKNRSLYKIIATQAEKDDLIQQDILPYSYRSRQIAIVTAKSMFRQFGSRVVHNGRRVRDDYWESKARKQGFTEDDMAGEKRPGAAKARESAAAEAAHVSGIPHLGHGDIVYSNGPAFEGMPHAQALQPGMPGMPSSLAPQLPMINLAPTEDPRMREFGNIPRPRQEITGAPYQDRTHPTSAADIMSQAAQTADFNKILNQQRGYRSKGLEDYWKKPREVPVSTPQQQAVDATAVPNYQSPHMGSSGLPAASQPGMQQAMAPQVPYTQQQHSQSTMAQSPVRHPNMMRPDQLHSRPSAMSLGSSGAAGQPSPYGYPTPQSQMWGAPPPQPSPLGGHHAMPQYSPQIHHQQAPSPHHPSQSPHPPQMHHQQGGGPPPGAMYGGMQGGGMPGGQYPMNARAMYQTSQGQQQFMPQGSVAQQPGGMQGWAGPPQQAHGGWSGYGP